MAQSIYNFQMLGEHMAAMENGQKNNRQEPFFEGGGDGEQEIDLIELFYRLLEKMKYIVLATLSGAILAGVISIFLLTPIFESTAKLYVLNSNDSAVNLSDLQIGTYLTSDYQEVFKTWEVHERVLEKLGLDYTYKQLNEMLTITNPNNTRILYITVKSPSPQEAALIANAYADVVREYIAEKMATEKPNILSKALEPTLPVSPNKTRNVLLGALLGALLACAVITVQFILDDKIKSTDDIMKYAGMPTLAVVPVLNDKSLRSAQNGLSGKKKKAVKK